MLNFGSTPKSVLDIIGNTYMQRNPKETVGYLLRHSTEERSRTCFCVDPEFQTVILYAIRLKSFLDANYFITTKKIGKYQYV